MTNSNRGELDDLKRKLSDNAYSVCKNLFGNAGRRAGNYYQIGDIHGQAGQSLYVHLSGHRKGYWRDEESGQHGDMLALIQGKDGLSFPDTIRAAYRILRETPPEDEHQEFDGVTSSDSARRFVKSARDIYQTLGERYCRERQFYSRYISPLRFHPTAYYKQSSGHTMQLPAIVAPVTNLAGEITGAARYFLSDDGTALSSSVPNPKTIMGRFFGNGVKFGSPKQVWAVGEGVENVLTVLKHIPHIPYQANLTAGSLGACEVPRSVKQLIVLLDRGDAGQKAFDQLSTRITADRSDVEITPILPMLDDFNDDECILGGDVTRDNLINQFPTVITDQQER